MRESITEFCGSHGYNTFLPCIVNIILPSVILLCLILWVFTVYKLFTIEFWVNCIASVYSSIKGFLKMLRVMVSTCFEPRQKLLESETVLTSLNFRRTATKKKLEASLVTGKELQWSDYGECIICVQNEFCPIKYYKLLKTVNKSFLPLKIWVFLFSIVAILLSLISITLPFSESRLAIDSTLKAVNDITPTWNFLFLLVSQFVLCLLVKILVSSEINLIPKGKVSATSSTFLLNLIICLSANILVFVWGFFDNLIRLALHENRNLYDYDLYLWGCIAVITIVCLLYSLYRLLQVQLKLYRLKAKYKKLLLLSSEKDVYLHQHGSPLDKEVLKQQTSNADHNLAAIDPYMSSLETTQDTAFKNPIKSDLQFQTPSQSVSKSVHYKSVENSKHGTGSTVNRNSFIEFSETSPNPEQLSKNSEYIFSSTITYCGCVCCSPHQKPEKKIFAKHTSPVSPLFKTIKAWSYLTFSWLSQTVHKASSRMISVEDLNKLPWYLDSNMLTETLETAWQKEVFEKEQNEKLEKQSKKKKNKKVNLVRVLFNLEKKYLFTSGAIKLLHDTIYQLGPVLLNFFIGFITKCNSTLYSDTASSTNPIGYLLFQGLGIILLIICSNLTQTMLLHQYFQILTVSGMKLRVSLCGFVYLKSLRYAYGQKSKLQAQTKQAVKKKKKSKPQPHHEASSTGEIVNLMSVDADRLVDVMPWIHLFWSAPFQIIFSLVILYTQLGVSMFVGVGIMLVSMPLATIVVTLMKEKFKEGMIIRDERLKVTQEVLNGIKIVKSYSWEEPFEKKIKNIRNNELHTYWIVSMYTVIQTTLWMCLPIIVSVASFSVYVATGNELSAAKAYTSMLAFQLLRFPLNSIPMVIGLYVQAYISCSRLQNFFMGDEIHPQPAVPSELMSEKTKPTIIASHMTLRWPNQAPLTNDITFKCYPGTITAIIGKTGVGKTGLISALVGTIFPEHTTFDGEKLSELILKGRVAYTAQTAWIQSLTLKDNILFGRPYKEDWYMTVVHACALEEDFKVLPEGDLTEIGERGVNLSGGQKQRIALARAVYQSGPFPTEKSVSPEEYPTDIFVLDDTLSAVDVHISNHIFEKCLKKLLCQRNKTVILSTHKVDILPQVDQIIFLGKTKMSSIIGIRANRTVVENTQSGTINDNARTNDDMSHESGSTVVGQNSSNQKSFPVDKDDYNVNSNVTTSEEESVVAKTLAVGTYEYIKTLPIFLEYVITEEVEAEKTEELTRVEVSSTLSPHHSGSFLAFSRDQSFLTAESSSSAAAAVVGIFARSPSSSFHEKNEEAAAPILQILDQSGVTGCAATPDNSSGLQSSNTVKHELSSVRSGIAINVQEKNVLQKQQQQIQKKESLIGNRPASSSIISTTVRMRKSISPSQTTTTPVKREQVHLFQDEQMEEGSVSFEVYWAYFRGFGGLPVLLSILFLFIGTQALSLSANLWLSHWLDNYKTISPINQGIATYAALGMGQMACAALSAALLLHAAVISSQFLHSRLLRRIFRAPMYFFDTTPLGRIIARFSKDLSTIDTSIPTSFASFLRTLFIVAETFTAITIALPLFLIIGIPLLGLYVVVQRRFLPCRRQLQRLNSVARAPLYTHFQETLDGFATIRAFRAQSRFLNMFESKMNFETRSNFVNVSLNRWLAVRLEAIGTLIVGSACLFAFFATLSNKITASLAGLAVTYALSVTQSLNWMVRMAGDLESQVVSVERVEQYTLTTPVEAPLIVLTNRPSEDWPQNGKVEFKNFSLRYRPELPVVLDQLSLSVHPNTKVGIVGRTGAGKSSIFSAVLRLVEASQGTILIDGVNIRNIGLNDLRTHLAIIPQDPVLFVGTLRFNVDPFNQYSDAEIWLAFERVHLKPFVETELHGNLGFPIDEGGRNISLGQKQLICFARALLKSCKILLLDEATSSIDPATDRLIQQTIRNEFKNSTVITIAHRLETIIDYDEIIVLDMGKVAEFGSPKELFEKDNIFRRLCLEGNISL